MNLLPNRPNTRLIQNKLPFAGSRGYSRQYQADGNTPDYVLDFTNENYRTSNSNTTLSNAATFSRSSDATYVDSEGILQTVSANTPRVGHHKYDGTSWVNKGLLLESETRTNLLHNTDSLPTQTETVTAQPYTLHFTGTGTITLSGASTDGPLVGTGTGENNRVSLTFTPSAGTLTLTVSGSVVNAQLEAGQTPSSYIPNLSGSGSVTRAAETLTGEAGVIPWNSSGVSIAMKGEMNYADTGTLVELGLHRWDAGSGNYVFAFLDTTSTLTGRVQFRQAVSGVVDAVASSDIYTPNINVPFSIASYHQPNGINGAVDGTALTENTTPTALADLSATDIEIGYDFMGTIESFVMWPVAIGDTGIEDATT